MARFIISYDLMKGKDYKKITDELVRLGACRVLFSVWVLQSPMSCKALADHLEAFLDLDDRMVVFEATRTSVYTPSLTKEEEACLHRFAS